MTRWPLLLLALISIAGHAEITAGDYSPLLIGVDPQPRIITGYYEDSTGLDERTGGPRFTCIFFLRGQMQGQPPYRVQTWFPGEKSEPEVINGRLWPAPSAIRLILDSEPAGCWNATPYRLAEKNGEIIDQEHAANWRAIRIVSARKAWLYDKPDQAKAGKSYFTTGNVVRIIDNHGKRLRITYLNAKGREISAWLDSADLYPDQPQRK